MPNRATLANLLAEIEHGTVRVDVEETVPLDAAPQALERFTNGHTKGKIVITIDG